MGLFVVEVGLEWGDEFLFWGFGGCVLYWEWVDVIGFWFFFCPAGLCYFHGLEILIDTLSEERLRLHHPLQYLPTLHCLLAPQRRPTQSVESLFYLI